MTCKPQTCSTHARWQSLQTCATCLQFSSSSPSHIIIASSKCVRALVKKKDPEDCCIKNRWRLGLTENSYSIDFPKAWRWYCSKDCHKLFFAAVPTRSSVLLLLSSFLLWSFYYLRHFSCISFPCWACRQRKCSSSWFSRCIAYSSLRQGLRNRLQKRRNSFLHGWSFFYKLTDFPFFIKIFVIPWPTSMLHWPPIQSVRILFFHKHWYRS